ncbi:MAG: carboxypeptidase-like regulatory domain-containing protein [Aquirufa sp.]
MIKNRLLYLFLLLFSLRTSAQEQKFPIITDQFFQFTRIGEIKSTLASKYHIEIQLDEKVDLNYRITYWFKDISVDKGLEEALKDSPYKTYIPSDGRLHVVARDFKIPLDEKQYGKAFTGKSTKGNFTLTGIVVDEISGEPLPFASVSLSNSKKGTQTNVDGKFSLPNIPSDTSMLLVRYVGYRPRKIYLNPKINSNNFVIELESDDDQLAEVTVIGEKTEVMKANEEIGMYKITPKNIAKLPNVGEKDIFRAFQLLPGISAANQNSSGLYVRGGTPDQNLVMYDGFTVYYVDHLYGFFSAFNSNPIKDVQLFKGGFESKFGGRISSVMEITSKNGNNKYHNVQADVSAMSFNAMAEGPIGKKITYLVAARRSWAGPLYTKIAESLKPSSTNTNAQAGGFGGGRGGRQFQSATVANSYFYDANAKISYVPNQKDVISLSLYKGDDNMDNSQTVNLPFRNNTTGGITNTDLSSWGNTGGSLKWSRKWSEKWYSNSLVSFSNFYTIRDNSNQNNFNRSNGTTQSLRFGSKENNNLLDFSFKTDLEGKVSENHFIGWGVQASQLKIDYSYSQNDTVKIISKQNNSIIVSSYLQDKIRLLDNRLEMTPGIRVNYFGVTQKIYLEPRFNSIYHVNKEIKLKGAWGNYYQFAKQIEREDIIAGSRNFWVLADGTDLPVTSSMHYILGASYEKGDYLFDIEGYYKDIQNDTRYTLRFTPKIGQGLKASETFFNGTGKVWGVDMLAQKKFGDFTGWVGYTLAKSTKLIPVFSPDPFPSNFDVRHEVKLVGMYKWRKWDFSSSFLFASGKPYTSILGSYTVTLLDGTVRDYTEPSNTNGNRFPAQHRLDIAATYNFKHGSIGLSVFNVYNRNNVWYKKFQTVQDPETGDRYLNITDVNYLGITPNITFSYHLK